MQRVGVAQGDAATVQRKAHTGMHRACIALLLH